MSNRTNQKKPAATDWHPADVIAALRKVNWSLRQLSLVNQLKPGTVNKALIQAYPKAEKIIADALGIEPRDIWPTRYHADGTPNRNGGRRPLNGLRLPHIRGVDHSPTKSGCNLQTARGEQI